MAITDEPRNLKSLFRVNLLKVMTSSKSKTDHSDCCSKEPGIFVDVFRKEFLIFPEAIYVRARKLGYNGARYETL
ncbi:hypothetical protein TNCV_3726851 [Trichonephila clavipes]|nr:hypothetical protein TNCV_3726851 [Trichonephila clavipes]